MGERVLVVEAPGRAVVCDEREAEPLADGEFHVRTLYSGLSAGTELSFFKGTNPALHAQWDPELGLFRPVATGSGYPVRKLGYMEVGTVTESRAAGVTAGSVVAMTYGHRTGYRGNPLRDRVIVLPEALDPVLGVYVAHMGPICANGLLHAAAELHGTDVRSLADGVRGRQVVVTGGGVVGLLTGLFARHHGAAEVVVVDPTPQRRAAATALGLTAADPDATDLAVELKSRWRHGPGDRGADVVFQCRGRSSGLALALRLLRPQGAVIDLAFYPDGAGDVRLGEEFHHNGLTVRCAQIGRVPRGTAHAWDRERLSAETVDLLLSAHEAITRHMITTRVPFEEAPGLLTDLAARRTHVLQAVLTFREPHGRF
jgi:NADPH:quinone reductase-like Zn-dependent oxidoreductase